MTESRAPLSLIVRRCSHCGTEAREPSALTREELDAEIDAGKVDVVRLKAECCAWPWVTLVGTARTVLGALGSLGAK